MSLLGITKCCVILPLGKEKYKTTFSFTFFFLYKEHYSLNTDICSQLTMTNQLTMENWRGCYRKFV